MAQSAGVQVFDNIMAYVLSRKPLTKEGVIRAAVVAMLADSDFEESAYYENPTVLALRESLAPTASAKETDG